MTGWHWDLCARLDSPPWGPNSFACHFTGTNAWIGIRPVITPEGALIFTIVWDPTSREFFAEWMEPDG